MKIILTISYILILSGCSMIPKYQRPEVNTPESWKLEAKKSGKTVDSEWWKDFGNQELNNIVQKALENNNDVKASIARIEQSRASLKITGASILPTADISADISKSRSSTSGSSIISTSTSGSTSVSYELDLFGKNRASIKKAEESLKASKFDTDALRLTVAGDAVNTYFTLLSLRQRLQVADSNLKCIENTLHVIEAQYKAGRTSSLALSQQKSAQAIAIAKRASIEESLHISENALAILLGQAPQTLNISNKDLSDIKMPDINAGLPSELLQRRPDVESAEASLLAANADIGVARAAYFPSINISSGLNVTSAGFSNPATTILSLASSVTAPIFSGGSIKGGVELANAKQKELIETYKKTVLTAFKETEDAFASVSSSKTRVQYLNIAQEEGNKSYSLSQKLYENGSIDFQTLLDTQRTMLDARDNYVQAKLSNISASVSLFKALGGGWSYNN